ncbi:hypothetical protein P7K49_021882 [Saguinus oedipus]|uniref:Uncharacterized protein n=1 Tax=Saguinus oedipus TaxID=9490 RepID=A0ABQ9UTW2_SAGOE|nr:hypothetical protein P7K49_021882 [Saguinus oedipus]
MDLSVALAEWLQCLVSKGNAETTTHLTVEIREDDPRYPQSLQARNDTSGTRR